MIGQGLTHQTLREETITTLTEEALNAAHFDRKRVLVIIPDGTRTAPIALMFKLLCANLLGRAAALDFLIALGTHQPMSEEQISRLVGLNAEERAAQFPSVHIFNHDWQNPETFVTLGEIAAERVAEISEGMLHQSVSVRINRLVTDYDEIVICGPVFPHEVVGFSGGNKYFFPGVSGPELIDLSHWLGALITSYRIIGAPGITPVRHLIDTAAALIDKPKWCFALVVAPGSDQLAGLYFDTPEAAWAAAAALSAQLHVLYVEQPFRRVLSIMPTMYDDIWTAAKGMYKLEPAIANGGEVVIYAPHVAEFSYTHGKLLAEIGYHVRDYFLAQWDKFKGYPGGVLAHSTHLRGIGTYDPVKGECPRITVTLATSISAERCTAHNLGYLDPASIDVDEWRGREAEGVFVVPKAGEMLYRLKTQA